MSIPLTPLSSPSPDDVLTEQLLQDVFALDAQVIRDPVVGTPLVVPIVILGPETLSSCTAPPLEVTSTWASVTLVKVTGAATLRT